MRNAKCEFHGPEQGAAPSVPNPQSAIRNSQLKIAILCPGPSLKDTFPLRGTNECGVRSAEQEILPIFHFALRTSHFALSHSGYSELIAVNRAAEFAACRWWVALDARTFSWTRPQGAPTLVCGDDQYRKVVQDHPEAVGIKHRSLSTLHLDLAAPGRPPVRWKRLGATVAVALAVNLGATEIDVYGADWSGTRDFDGHADPRNRRDEKRWEDERKTFAELAAVLAERGIVLRRINKCEAPFDFAQGREPVERRSAECETEKAATA